MQGSQPVGDLWKAWIYLSPGTMNANATNDTYNTMLLPMTFIIREVMQLQVKQTKIELQQTKENGKWKTVKQNVPNWCTRMQQNTLSP